MSRTERAGKGVIANIFNYGGQIVIQLLLAPVILSLAGQEILGAYAIIIQIIGYLILLDMGFNFAFIRYLAYANGLDDNGRYFREVMNAGWACLTAVGVVYVIVTSLLAIHIGAIVKLSPHVEFQARTALLMLAGWGLIRFPLSVFRSALPAIQDMAFRHLSAGLANAMRLGFSLGLVYWGYGLVGLVGGAIGGEVLDILVCRWRYRCLLPEAFPRFRPIKWNFFKELYIFGLQAMAIIIADKLILFSDNIVVGYLFGPVATSIYYITQLPALMGNKFVFTLYHNASPALNQMEAQNDPERLRNAYLKLQRYTLLLVIPFAVSLVGLNASFIKLWVGSAQFGGQLMTLWLAIFACSIGTRVAGQAVLIAKGCIGILSMVLLMEGLVNLGLSLWLGRKLGLQGIALATLIASAISWSYVQYRVHKELLLSFMDIVKRCVLPAVMVTSIYSPILFVAKNLFLHNTWRSFALVAGIALGAWALIFFILGAESNERTILFGWVQGVYHKTFAIQERS
jgi:O-antigen/teichoic acid export membrane protein